jgi:hypothetical protein
VDELAKHLGVDELAIGCFKLKHFADVPKHLPTLKHVTGVCLLKHKVFIYGRSTATFITAHQIMYYTLFLHSTKLPS